MKLLLFSGLIFLQSFLHAQSDSILSFEVDPQLSNLAAGVDQKGAICTHHRVWKTSYIKLFNHKGRLKKETEIKSIKHMGPVYTIVDNINAFGIYYSLKEKEAYNEIGYLPVNKISGEVGEVREIEVYDDSKEDLVSEFTHERKWFIITKGSKSYELFVRVFDGAPMCKLYKISYHSPTMFSYLEKNKWSFINKTYGESLKSGMKELKIFYAQDKLYFVADYTGSVDKRYGETTIFEVDYLNQKGEVKVHKTNWDAGFKNQNAVVCDSLLFKLTITPNVFDLEIINLNTFETVKDFRYTKEDNFDLYDYDIYYCYYEAGFMYTMADSLSLGGRKTKKIINKLSQWSPSLIVKKLKDDNYKMVIGSKYSAIGIGAALSMYVPSGTTTFGVGPTSRDVAVFFESTISGYTLEKEEPSKVNLSPISRHLARTKKAKKFSRFENDEVYLIFYRWNSKRVEVNKVDVEWYY